MDVRILGSGTLLPDDAHRSPSHLVEYRGRGTLLDCGSGTLHGFSRDGLDWAGVTRVVISHFHTDHFGDLAPLMWAWTHGVAEDARRSRTILGPSGLRSVLRSLAAAFGEFVLEPGGPLEVVELEPGGEWVDPVDGVRIRAHEARHMPESIAVRLECGDGSVGYTGDTGPHPPLAGFFRDVDVLVSECAVADGSGSGNHMGPEAVAELAVDARPKRLVLTHVYPTLGRRGLAERIRALGYRGEVHVAFDGLRLRV